MIPTLSKHCSSDLNSASSESAPAREGSTSHRSPVTSHRSLRFFLRAQDNHASSLFRVHRGVIHDHGVRSARQRGHLPLAVPAVALAHIRKHFLEFQRPALFLPLALPPFRAHFPRRL